MTVNYYDLLNVEPTASRDEIRGAWKRAVGELDPSDRRFRAFNSAAEVLLDDDRRREYDAQLAADAPAEPETALAAPAPISLQQYSSEGPADFSDRPATTSLRGWLVPAWLLVLLLVATVAVGGFDLWRSRTPTDAQVATDTTDAQAAAERAIVPLLSYDYRNLGASKAAATAYLSPSYQQCYDKLFTLIEQNAPATQPVINTQVVSSGIVRSGDGDRVQVLVFVDRPTTNKAHRTPVVYHDEVTMTMVKSGGQWLVDWLQTQANSQVTGDSTGQNRC